MVVTRLLFLQAFLTVFGKVVEQCLRWCCDDFLIADTLAD